ncbi:MAG: phospholipase, partial [Gemmatimonadales bacterium]
YVPDVKRGKPKIFVSHGIGDPVLPFGNTRDLLVPQLRSEGYNVELALFQGVHEVPFDIETRGMDWFLAANS